MENDAVETSACSSLAENGGEDVWSCNQSDAALTDRLVVMVHGILGSASDWKFATEQFVRILPDKVFVHFADLRSLVAKYDVSAIVSCLLGPEQAEKIKIFAGDVVPRKKSDPAIYMLAATTLAVQPSSCVVVEDSAIGLAVAKAAGMKCIVTKSRYTAEEDFVNADAVFDCIGDPPKGRFDVAFCGSLLEKQYVS